MHPILVRTWSAGYVRRMRIRAGRAAGLTVAVMIALGAGCAGASDGELSSMEKRQIADSLTRLVTSAYDLTRPDPVANLMSLYPLGDSVISASAGQMTRTRAQLEQQVRTFWTYVGSNMQKPRWEWTSMAVDVLSPNAAVMTGTYRIPHATPEGRPHVLGGAWTAVFANRGGRWVIVQEHLSDLPSPPE